MEGILKFNPLTYTQSYLPRGTRRGLKEPLPRVFDMLQCLSKRFCLQWKAFDPLDMMRYISLGDLVRHFVFYQELEIR